MQNQYYKLQRISNYENSNENTLSYIKSLILQNYKVYDMLHNSGDLVPYHTHSHEETILIKKGRMRMIIEENFIELQAGNILTIEPWAIHLSCFPYKEGADFYLCFPPKRKNFSSD